MMKIFFLVFIVLSACPAFAGQEANRESEVLNSAIVDGDWLAERILSISYDMEWIGVTDSGRSCQWTLDYGSYFEDSGAFVVSYKIDGIYKDQRVLKVANEAKFIKTVTSDGLEIYTENIQMSSPGVDPGVVTLQPLDGKKVRLAIKNGTNDIGGHCIVNQD